MTLVTEPVQRGEQPASSPIVVCNTPGEWGRAALFCAVCFLAMWTYHDVLRHKPYSLHTANECSALAAAYAVGLAILLGPLHRLTGGFRSSFRLRRPLGVLAGACALVHVVLAVVSWEPLENGGQVARFVLGFPTLLLMSLLVGLSWHGALSRLGRDRWKRLQGLAPLLLAVIVAHFMAAGKVAGWVDWFRTFGKADHLPGPSSSIFLFLFCVVVFAARGLARLRGKRGGAVALLAAAGLAAGSHAASGTPAPTLELLCGPALRPAVTEVLRAFEKQAGVRVQVSYDASGALLGQLRLHPHGDLFLPADRFYTDEAVARGLAEAPTVVALFRPVILVGKGNPRGIHTLADLTKRGVRVGIGEERSTAIGKSTLALLKRNHIALARVPVVYRAAKIDELANAVRLGSIDAAIVWDAVAWGYRGRAVVVPIPAGSSVTVPVAAAIVSSSKRKALAGKLVAFMTSATGRAILMKHHYSVP